MVGPGLWGSSAAYLTPPLPPAGPCFRAALACVWGRGVFLDQPPTNAQAGRLSTAPPEHRVAGACRAAARAALALLPLLLQQRTGGAAAAAAAAAAARDAARRFSARRSLRWRVPRGPLSLAPMRRAAFKLAVAPSRLHYPRRGSPERVWAMQSGADHFDTVWFQQAVCASVCVRVGL